MFFAFFQGSKFKTFFAFRGIRPPFSDIAHFCGISKKGLAKTQKSW